MPGIRSFIAIELPSGVRAALADAATRLARTEADVKWVEAANLHLTLKFLGDVALERQPRLLQALGDLAAAQAPFTLAIGGLGCFPSLEEPHVVWAGLRSGAGECAALWRAVEGSCVRLGFARERKPFSPHVTLGRQRTGFRTAALASALSQLAQLEFGLVTVGGLTLFQSDLRPSGPVYTSLGEFPFTA